MHEKQLCPVCLKSGRRSNLTSFQVNFDEALWLCEYKRCIYPLGQDSEPTFNRPLDDIPSEKDVQTRAPSAQVALQMQVANRLAECHQKKQTDVIGIQTGSPLFMKTKIRQKGLKHASFNGLQNGGKHGNLGFNGLKNGDKHSHIGSNGIQNGDKAGNVLYNNFQTDTRSSSFNGAKNPLQSFKSSDLLNGNSVTSDILNGNAVPTELHHTNFEKNYVFEGLQLGKHRINGQNNQCGSANLPVSFNQTLPQNSSFSAINGKILDQNLQTSNLYKPQYNGYSVVGKAKANPSLVNGCVSQSTECFIQWKNKEALCWLDVLLCLIVHNKTLKQSMVNENQRDSLVYKLIQAHKQATLLLTNQKSVGGGTEKSVNRKSSQVEIQTKDMKKKFNKIQNCIQGSDKTLLENDSTDPGVILDTIRDEIWEFLEKKVHCERGKPSSPVLALPILLQSEPDIDKLFRSTYKFVYKCPKCQFVEDTNCESVLPSLPDVVKDFHILNPVHKKKCLNCSYTKGKRQMVYKTLPKSFMMHFIDGLPPGDWNDLEFTFNNVYYTVTGVVQYRRNPDHFVAWLRNPDDNTWIECDGLKSPVSTARVLPPKFPWKQIHIVMWEQAQSVHGNGTPGLDKILIATKVCTINSMSQNADELVVRNGCLGATNNIMKGLSAINDSKIGPITEPEIRSTKEQKISISTNTKNPSACISLASVFDPINGSHQSGLSNGNANMEEQDGLVDNSFPKQQISIDTHKFLSSSTANSSTYGRTGSSLSSTCSELSDNVSLPEFTSTTQLGNELVKPIPCRNDSPVENSEFSCRNACEADPHFNQTFNKLVKNAVTNTSQSGFCPSRQRVNKGPTCNKVVPDIKPSSVFKSPLKNKIQEVTLGRQTNESLSKSQTSAIDSIILPTLLEKPKSTCVESDDVEKLVSKATDVKVEPSAEDSSQKRTAHFKFPSLLRMKSKSSTISRDAFKTLSKSIPKAETSPTSSPRASPAKTLAASPYLSAVKHYLINKTTDIAQHKTRFQGLNLKSAPIFNKTVDLSDLKRNDTSSNTSASPSSEPSSQNSKTDSLCQNSRSKTDSDSLLKRRKKTPTEDAGVKRQKTSLKPSQSEPEFVARKLVCYPNEGNMKTNGHTFVHVTPDKKNIQIQNATKSTTDSLRYAQPNNKENGNKNVTPEKSKNTDLETDSVLQDLYDALNIPFTSIKDTMSDIMVDVNDILGVVETTDLIPATPQKTDNLHCTVGNQGQLDCGQSMTSRLKPQSGLMAQNIDWSTWTSGNNLLIIS